MGVGVILPTTQTHHNLSFTYVILICARALFPLQTTKFLCRDRFGVHVTSVAMSYFLHLVPPRLACLPPT